MSKEQNNLNQKFQSEFKKFKDNHNPDYDLIGVFEIYLPFWVCKQNVVIQKEIEIDRFSKIILQIINNGIIKHTEVCQFLGIDTNSFVTTQFHFLIKNGLLNDKETSSGLEYEISNEGLSFLERKSKVAALETIEFEYFYNDLTLEFLNKQRFEFYTNDLTKEYIDINMPFDSIKISDGKRKKFSAYVVKQTNSLQSGICAIPHKNKPINLNKVDFATFFNKQQKDVSFYDFERSSIETHRRSISFLAFEYINSSGNRIYDIRRSPKTVVEFYGNEIEENLSKYTTEYYRKHPLSGV